MSRWLKRLLVGGLVVLVLLGGALGVLLATIDQQAYKTWLQDHVQERYGRTLEIKGDVGISLFPDLGLRASNVVLSEPNETDWFATVKEVKVSVSIRPLLERKLSIDHISLDGLDIKLKRDRHGNWNVSDLTRSGRNAPVRTDSPARAADASVPMKIDLHKLDIRRASITVLDRTQPWMTAKNVTASVVMTGGSRDYDLSVTASLDEPEAGQGEISIKSRIHIEQDVSKITAKGSEIKVTKARWHANPGWRQVELSLTADALSSQLSSSVVSVSNVAWRVKGLQGGDRFEWAADVPTLQIEKSKGMVPALNGRLRLDGVNALDAKYNVSGLSFQPGLVEMREAKLDVGLKQASRFYKLEVETPLIFKTGKTIHAASAQGTLHLADASLPAGGINLPFNGELGYDLGKKEASWKLSTSFLKSSIDVSGLASRLDQNVPSLSVSLGTDLLDMNAIDAFLNQPKTPVKTPQSGVQSKPGAVIQTPTTTDSSSKSAPLLSVEPADQTTSSAKQEAARVPAVNQASWMRDLDLDLNVRVKRFVWKNVQAGQVRFRLHVGQGKAELRSLEGDLYGGTLSATGGLTDSKGLPAFLKGKLQAVQVEPLMSALSGQSVLGGLGNMNFDLKAYVADSASLLSSLDGQSQIDIKQGYVRGLDLDKGVEALSEPAARANDLPLKMDPSKRTNFAVMQTQVLFGQGLARFYKLNLSSSNIRITEGKIAQIGLLDGALNIVTEVQFTGNIGLPGARVAIQVRSLMLPLHVGGTLQDPQVRVHWQSMPEGALKQSLQQLFMQGVIGGSGGFVGVGTTTPSAPAGGSSQTSPNPATQLENVIRGLFRK